MKISKLFLLISLCISSSVGFFGCEEETSTVYRPGNSLTDSTAAMIQGYVRETGTLLPIPNASIISDDNQYIRSIADGSYSFRVLEGDRIITAGAENYENTDTSLTLQSGSEYNLDFFLTLSTVLVSGRVTDLVNSPIYQVQISCAGEETTTDRNGRYQIVVPAGTRTMYVTAAGYISVNRIFTATANQPIINFDFRLEPGSSQEETGQITGRVTNEQGSSIADAFVSSDDGESDYTNSNGNYQLFVQSGNRTITTIAIGYQPQSVQQLVETNRWYFIDFMLVKQ